MVVYTSARSTYGGFDMPYKKIANARQKAVGTKQTMKAVNKGRAVVVYVAKDADRHVTEPIIKECRAKGVPVEKVDSMKNLGKACKIDVRCAVAAIVKD